LIPLKPDVAIENLELARTTAPIDVRYGTFSGALRETTGAGPLSVNLGFDVDGVPEQRVFPYTIPAGGSVDLWQLTGPILGAPDPHVITLNIRTGDCDPSNNAVSLSIVGEGSSAISEETPMPYVFSYNDAWTKKSVTENYPATTPRTTTTFEASRSYRLDAGALEPLEWPLQQVSFRVALKSPTGRYMYLNVFATNVQPVLSTPVPGTTTGL